MQAMASLMEAVGGMHKSERSLYMMLSFVSRADRTDTCNVCVRLPPFRRLRSQSVLETRSHRRSWDTFLRGTGKFLDNPGRFDIFRFLSPRVNLVGIYALF